MRDVELRIKARVTDSMPLDDLPKIMQEELDAMIIMDSRISQLAIAGKVYDDAVTRDGNYNDIIGKPPHERIRDGKPNDLDSYYRGTLVGFKALLEKRGGWFDTITTMSAVQEFESLLDHFKGSAREIARMHQRGEISGKIADMLIEESFKQLKQPSVLVKEMGLKQLGDQDGVDLESLITKHYNVWSAGEKDKAVAFVTNETKGVVPLTKIHEAFAKRDQKDVVLAPLIDKYYNMWSRGKQEEAITLLINLTRGKTSRRAIQYAFAKRDEQNGIDTGRVHTTEG